MKEFRLKTRPRIIAIYGLRGLGKTVLVEEAARMALSDKLIDDVCWQTSKTQKLMGPKIEKIRNKQVKSQDIIQKFENFKETNPTKKILFVLENVDAIDNPKELFIRLTDIIGDNLCFITSRNQICHQFVRPVLLKGLTEDEGLSFLRSQAKILQVEPISKASDDKLKDITREMGGNALALKLLVVLSKFLPIDSAKERIIDGTLDLETNGGSIYRYVYYDLWTKLHPTAKQILNFIGKIGETCVFKDIEYKFPEFSEKKLKMN